MSLKKLAKIDQTNLFHPITNLKSHAEDEDILILDKLNFNNWLKIVHSANIVITPECGCSHLSAAANVPVNIIYDPHNLPDAINKEYAPWNSIYNKFIFDDNNLNQNLINVLN